MSQTFYSANPEIFNKELHKLCSICKQVRPLFFFIIRHPANDMISTETRIYCKTCERKFALAKFVNGRSLDQIPTPEIIDHGMKQSRDIFDFKDFLVSKGIKHEPQQIDWVRFEIFRQKPLSKQFGHISMFVLRQWSDINRTASASTKPETTADVGKFTPEEIEVANTLLALRDS